MVDDFLLDEMDLPLANPNEELETVSNNFFKPLFDVSKFEIRSEDFRDKGIDFHIEIKKASKHTNFRFAVQLKATEILKANSDGSTSLQLNTSNINYLLNTGMPAYYVLYSKNSNTFYYENLNDFVKSVSDKNPEWQKQGSHVLRFNKMLDSKGIDEMYNVSIKKGLLQRKINETLALQTSSVSSGDKILIDVNLNVNTDAEIRRVIEAIGLSLVNEGRWREILLVHKKASGNIASTSKYNLVLGIANYYSGNLIDALSFFKASLSKKSELSAGLHEYLSFFEVTVRYSIGLISDEDYQQKTDQLESTEEVGLHIKLEKAKRKYIDTLVENPEGSYEQYLKDIEDIIRDPKASKNIQLNARCELILIEGSKKNMNYVRNVAMLKAHESMFGPDLNKRVEAVKTLIQSKELWFKNVQSIKEEALQSKNYFVYYNAVVNEVKVSFEFEVYIGLVFLEDEIPGVPPPERPDNKPRFDEMLEKIDHAYEYYKNIGHIENTVVTLSAKYELLHYLGDFNTANTVLAELEMLIETYEMKEIKRRFEFLKNKGTTHEKFKAWMDEIFSEANTLKAEIEGFVEDMKSMDDKERTTKTKIENPLHIHLYPIGYFQFSKNETEKVYQILNITEQTKASFNNLFNQKVIPVANIYHCTINKEGFGSGKLDDKGIESWRNIYRIRKSFYDNKFFRNENIG